MPEAERARIFEPFFRGARERAGGGGAGLGLSIVRAIARAHGGDVHLDAAPGERRGARFVVRLPLLSRAFAARCRAADLRDRGRRCPPPPTAPQPRRARPRGRPGRLRGPRGSASLRRRRPCGAPLRGESHSPVVHELWVLVVAGSIPPPRLHLFHMARWHSDDRPALRYVAGDLRYGRPRGPPNPWEGSCFFSHGPARRDTICDSPRADDTCPAGTSPAGRGIPAGLPGASRRCLGGDGGRRDVLARGQRAGAAHGRELAAGRHLEERQLLRVVVGEVLAAQGARPSP